MGWQWVWARCTARRGWGGGESWHLARAMHRVSDIFPILESRLRTLLRTQTPSLMAVGSALDVPGLRTKLSDDPFLSLREVERRARVA